MAKQYVKFDASDVRKWIDGSEERRGKLIGIFDRIGVDGENLLKRRAEPLSVTGKNYNSISHKVSGNALATKRGGINLQVAVKADSPYAEVTMETGRKPGKAPPPKALERWVRLKGLGIMSVATSGHARASFGSQRAFTATVKNREKSIAFAISKKIAKSGTNRYINKGRKLVTETYKIIENSIIPKRLKEIADALVK